MRASLMRTRSCVRGHSVVELPFSSAWNWVVQVIILLRNVSCISNLKDKILRNVSRVILMSLHLVYFLILWTLSWMAFDPYGILLNALPGNYLYECEDHQLICFYGGFFLTGLRKIVCMFDGDLLVLTVSV